MPRSPFAASAVAVVPMAGEARRLGPLPVSKELLPVGVAPAQGGIAGASPRLELACEGLLSALVAAGVRRALLAVTPTKLDIPRQLASGASRGLALAYPVVEGSRSMPETVCRALAFAGNSPVVLGFGDVLFEPPAVVAAILERLERGEDDVVLACFPAPEPATTEMVDLAPDGRVRRFELRPAASELPFNWLLAAWRPSFSAFLPGWLAERAAHGPEPGLGEALTAALEAGLSIRGVPFPGGRYLDLGSPERLELAWRFRRATTAHP
ncbi:MAG TPA: hypothetical protein VF017_20270 [Thermoanaerobaculia bacterium]|nr:hypothetical protein [Thermoanaerobaculia bacterium]